MTRPVACAVRVEHEPRRAVDRSSGRVGGGAAERGPQLARRVGDAADPRVVSVEDVLGDARRSGEADAEDAPARRSHRRDRHAVLPMHVASGVLPGRCVGGAGTPYSSTPTSEKLRCGLGDGESSERVLERLQTTSEVEVPSSVNTARELTKYSVPPPEPGEVVARNYRRDQREARTAVGRRDPVRWCSSASPGRTTRRLRAAPSAARRCSRR